MRYTNIIFLLFFVNNLGISQDSKPIGQVDYYYESESFLSLYGKSGEATLYFNRDKFYFKSNTVPQSDKTIEEGTTIDFTRGDRFGFPILSDYKKQLTYSRITIVKKSALLIEPLVKWEWTLIDSTKTIAGFKCYLAKGNGEDKVFNAWYCPEISISAGPKYICGLPGLILEASSTNNEERYYLKSLKLNKEIDFVMEIPKTKIIFNGFCEYLKKLKEIRLQTNKEYISEGELPIDWNDLDVSTGFKAMLEYDNNCLKDRN